jgi:hypothetical protein
MIDCQNARDWLLVTERPGQFNDAPPELRAHVISCAGCQRLASRLEGLEQRYRDELQTSTVEPPSNAFLVRLQAPPARRRLRWLALAAMVLLAIGPTTWLLFPARREAASVDVTEELVNWNLELTQSRTSQQRSRIYHERAADLEAAIETAKLPEEEHELAVALLDSGGWLVANAHPADEVDRFNDLADRLLTQLDFATTKKDARRIRKLARFYRRIAERGIQANLERAEQSGALDFQRQRKLERAILRDAERARKLAELLDRAPNASRKEIRRALDIPRKAPRKKKKK